MRRLALLVLVVAVLAALPKLLGGPDLTADVTSALGLGDTGRARATVLRIRDGDTIRVRLVRTGVEEEVRLLGIDTPEVRENLQCGGDEATTSMQALTPVGSTVVLTSDPSQGERDRYDRLLRYVGRSGEDVGLAQIRSGLARTFVFEDDPFDRVEAYERAERRAEQAQRGSWARCWH